MSAGQIGAAHTGIISGPLLYFRRRLAFAFERVYGNKLVNMAVYVCIQHSVCAFHHWLNPEPTRSVPFLAPFEL